MQADGRTALVMAHPGHELLLHHWMEQTAPIVFALTDGSGWQGECRRRHSIRVIEAAGGSVGGVFGHASDQRWYEAILAGDLGLFHEAMFGIVQDCVRQEVSCVVADAVELFNPMHDLCAAVARGVVLRLRDLQREVRLYEQRLDLHGLPVSPCDEVLSLDSSAVERKLAAARGYTPLHSEVAAWEAGPGIAAEQLRQVPADGAWPERLTCAPAYETVGRRRIAEGKYSQLIEYHAHVRPLAVALSTA